MAVSAVAYHEMLQLLFLELLLSVWCCWGGAWKH